MATQLTQLTQLGKRRKLRVAGAALASLIFIVDTFTDANMPFGVLYIAVVLITAGVCQAREIVLIGAGCISLTLLSYALSQSAGRQIVGIVNLLISAGAIGVTTLLALQGRSVIAALRESEERFRTLVQFSFDVYWETDEQHRFTRQIFAEGLKDAPGPSSEIGKTRWEVPYVEPDEDAWRNHRETVDAHLPFRDFELSRPALDGGKRYVAVSGLPVFDDNGRFIGYRGVGRHITEQKRTEEELRQREKELRDVVETIPAMTWTAEPDGTTVFVNRRWTEYTGVSVQDAAGSDWKNFIHSEDFEDYAQQRRASLASGEPFESEARFRRRDGEYRWYLARVEPLRDVKGSVLKWYGILTDIEDRKQSEAFLAEAQKLTHTGSWAWDIDSDQGRRWSEEMFRIYGLDPERDSPPNRDQIWAFLHPEDFASFTQQFERARDEKADFVLDHRIVLPDGAVKHVHVIGHAVLNEARALTRYVGTAVDVTDRKRAEAELRSSEARFRTFADHATDAFFLYREDSTILDVNREACESLGYTRDELIGMKPFEYGPDLTQEMMQRIRERLRAGRTITYDGRHRRKDGTFFPVEVRIREFRHGDRWLALSLVRDITQRKRTEHLIQQVLLTSPDAIAVIGRDYRYRRVNPGYERNWGMPPESIVGKNVADLSGTQVFDQLIKPRLDRCFAGEEVSIADWFTNSLGRRYHVVTYSPLRLDSERVEAALVIIRDLTDHVLASEALREAQSELAHVNRVTTMGQLTASIAHEVNQPIAAAVTNAQAALRWLNAQQPNIEEVRGALSRIVENGIRAGEVIGRIRAHIKKAPSRKDDIAINDAILETVALTSGEAAKHGVSVRTELASDLPLINGDRIQLQQVVLNLIINAIEAMSGASEGQRELVISASKTESDGLLVSVRDSGPGLAPAALERLFEPFYTTKSNGMGLGLSICRSIIDAHGGRLWARANVPGAVFQFTLPAHSVPPS